MTNSEHAALSAELARALGWKYVYPHSRGTTTAWLRRKHDYVAVSDGPGPRGTMLAWRKFDYRDPAVCLPLIEWLGTRNVTIYFDFMGAQVSIRLAGIEPFWVEAPTIHECVARAVIAVKKGKS